MHRKAVSTTIKEVSPAGVRLEVNDRGEVKGKYHAVHINTVNVLVKPDGTNEWESKAIETTKEGDMVVLWGSGKGPAAYLGADSWEGEVHYMTTSPRLAWLNNTTAWVEGTGNGATGECQGKVYARSNPH